MTLKTLTTSKIRIILRSRIKKIMTHLYNIQTGLPDGLDSICGIYKLQLTNHAKQSANSDRYGRIEIPQFARIEIDSIFEVELNDYDQIEKVLIRQAYDQKNDLILVLIPRSGHIAILKTVWLNRSNDNHSTLDKTKYMH